MIISVADRLNTTKEYYFSVKLDEIRKMKAEGTDVINAAIGNPDLPPDQTTVNSLIEEVQKHDVHGYPPYRGIPELRNSISLYYKNIYNVELDPTNEILPLIGSKEGITHISLAFLNPGDKVLVPELGYPAYKAVSEMIGAQTIQYPMNESDWQPNFEELYKIDTNGVKILWLNYPNMPTGAPAKIETFQKIVDFAKERKILLCHDNPYSLILNQRRPISLLSIEGVKDVAIELNSLSKSHNMAGWRIGWLSSNKEYVDAIVKVKSNVDTGMFMPLQKAAAQALMAPYDWHEERNSIYKERKKLAIQIIEKLGCTYDPACEGMFIWAKIPDEMESSKWLIDKLLYEHHVFIAPGFIFGNKGERYIRISLCLDASILEKIMERIKGF